jgi:NAD(P)-dependent dehydrogenase (short-subunit alcohol dehydrogenase family)
LSLRVLVTGASRGIGLALVQAHLGRGDEVWAAVRSPSPELEAIESPRLHVLALDVSSEASVKAAAAACTAPTLDRVIANAGINGGPQHAPGMDLAQVARVIDTNAIGVVRLYDAFIARVRDVSDGRAAWVNVSSEAGSLGAFRASSKPEYAMSKAALNALTRWMASVEKNITVVSIDPGWTRTGMGGGQAPYTAEQTAGRLMAAIDALTPSDTGSFVDAELKPVPW